MSIFQSGAKETTTELKGTIEKPIGGIFQNIVGVIVDNTKTHKEKMEFGIEISFPVITIKAENKKYNVIIPNSNYQIAIDGNFPIGKIANVQTQVKQVQTKTKRVIDGKSTNVKRPSPKYIYREHELY